MLVGIRCNISAAFEDPGKQFTSRVLNSHGDCISEEMQERNHALVSIVQNARDR